MLIHHVEIRAAARAAGLTIPELCEQAGVHPKTFGKWESGQSKPTIRILEKLNAVLEKVAA